MKKCKKEIYLTLFLTFALFFPNLTQGQPNYKKLYNDGYLSLTAIEIQEKSGSKWDTAAKYKLNGKYRMKMRFTNFSKAKPVTSSQKSYSKNGRHISCIKIKLALKGAKFDKGNRNWVMKDLTNHSDFNDCIKPEKSRYFYVYFTWKAAIPALVRIFPIDIRTWHRELVYLKYGPKTTLNVH